MTQATQFSVPTTGPVSPDVMAGRIADNFVAALTGHSGASRPSYAEAGTIWQDTSVTDTVRIYFYDGAQDILLATINKATNKLTMPSFTAGGAILDAVFAAAGADTKKLALNLAAITAGQTRNLIMPDRDVDLSRLGIFSMGAVVPSSNTIAFTGIPAGVRRIRIPLEDISTNGTGIPTLQVGDSGGYLTTGYKGTASNVAAAGVNSSLNSGGFRLCSTAITAATTFHGTLDLTRIGSSIRWSFLAIPSASDGALSTPTGGSITLTNALDRIRITTSDTFDAQGSIDCQYEF